MNRYYFSGVVVALLIGSILAAEMAEMEAPKLPEPQRQHQWLMQFVGEWDAEATMQMDPNSPPVTSRGTESVRAIGGFWVLAEDKGTHMGKPFTGVMTLGYDLEKKRFVGSWVDSMSTHLWTYVGTLDEAGKVLTLEGEGPCPMGPAGKLSKFRETIELKSNDHRVFTSSMQNEKGEWVKMVTIEYRRKTAAPIAD